MIEIIPVPAFTDNYIWMISRGRNAAVVDPGDARPVLKYLSERQLILTAILNTHHHSDHVGGNSALLQVFNVPVFGPARETIPGVTQALTGGQRIDVPGINLQLSVMDIPGHTSGHIAYFSDSLLFCGDTLFGCGCGRLFEGTPAQMLSSLKALAALPENTQVYCGHEYTLANIRFALLVETGNAALRTRDATDRAKREQGLATLPATIELERLTNPFLRCTEPAVVAAAQGYAGRLLSGPVEVFSVLRGWKNAL